MVFVVGPMVPSSVKTLADFIAWCRSNPTQASYGSPGAGSPLHFLGVMLSRAANFEYLHVPFQGTAPSIQSLLGSQIASCISPIGPFVPHVRARTLRALATTGAQRSPLLPDVPTIAEAGFPALKFAEWFGIFVPARLPAEPSRRSAAPCVRRCKPRKSRLDWPINRWMSAVSRRPSSPARSKPTSIAGDRS